LQKIKKLTIFIILITFLVGCNNDEIIDNNNSNESSNEERYAELIESREALEILAEGVEALVYDIETGITYNVRRVIGGYNTLADVETLTLEDTNNLLETAGGQWNVRRRAVIVYIDDYRIAASIAPFPHSGREDYPFGEIVDNRNGATGTGINLNSIQGNGKVGVVDIFFWNSLVPGINRVDERHQEAVLRAYEFQR